MPNHPFRTETQKPVSPAACPALFRLAIRVTFLVASHCPESCPERDLGVAVLCRALAGVEILHQEDEGQEVGWAQGAGVVAVERTGSRLACLHCPCPQVAVDGSRQVRGSGAGSLPSIVYKGAS